jgi:hypothetical protein
MNMFNHILLAIALFSASPSQPAQSQHATMPAAEAAVSWPVVQDPVRHSQSIKISKGRNVSVDFQANADGNCYFTFAASNMVFGAGCHAVAHIDLLDAHGNILARIAMPKLGLKPAWFAKEYKRQVSFEAKLTAEARAKLRSVRFAASEDAGGPGFLTELRDAVVSLRQL